MGKSIYKAEIISNVEIAKDVWRMEINCSDVAQTALPGQFVNLYLDRQDLLLPRPLSVCKVEAGVLTLVYGVVGKGTGFFAAYLKGDTIRLSDPLGRGYILESVKKGQKAILIGGGIGVPPLLQFARALIIKEVEVMAVIGFKSEPFLAKELESEGAKVYVATDTGKAGFNGNVVDLMKANELKADHYFACGPRPMLKSVFEYCKARGSDIQVSLEERMGCGYGACVGCVCKIRETKEDNEDENNIEEGQIHRKKVCLDGPVFWGSEVIWSD